MVLSKILLGIIIYITFCVIIGIIKFPMKVKKYILGILSIAFNGFMGYGDTIVFLLMYAYFSNQPKGSGYSVPDSDAGINAIMGLITFTIYIFILIPINIFLYKKSKISRKVYLIVNILSTIIGLVIYWIFLDKSKRLF